MKKDRRFRNLTALPVSLATVLLTTSGLHAQEKNWNATDGSWLNAANWTPGGVPSFDFVLINNNGTARLASGTGDSLLLVVGNTATGALSVEGGTLSTLDDASIGEGASATGVASVSSGAWNIAGNLQVGTYGNGTLNLTASGAVSAATLKLALYANSTGVLNIGTGGSAGSLTTAEISGGAGNATVRFNHTGSLLFSTPLKGSLSVIKTGSGTTTLSGSNTYTGSTTVSAGELVQNSANAIAANTALSLTGGLLTLNHSLTVSSLAGSAGQVAVTSGNQLTVNQSSSTTYSGTITGAGGLAKSGSGTLALTSASSYSGATTVSAGTLRISDVGTNSVLGTSSLNVASGGTLSGTGRVLGATSVLGALRPGNPTGTLTFSNGLTLSSSSAIHIDLASATPSLNDQIALSGSIAYGGSLIVSLINGFTPAVNDSFVIFSGVTTQSGTFSSISFTNPGYSGAFNYGTGTLTITAVPEPATVSIALAVFSAVLVGFRHRRKKQASLCR